MSGEILFSTGECVLGSMLVATSARGVCAIFLGDDASRLGGELKRQFPHAALRAARSDALVSKVAAFLATPAGGLDERLDMQ
jgi:AraC family transcriptional regulator of adaptative response/methylated-DNA-[protein]-cysteine methyltransferase